MNMNINICPATERPRERLLAHGPGALTDAELLAVLLRAGVPGASSLDVAHDLLAKHRNLSGVMRSLGAADSERRGVGPAKVAQLKASVELARRLLAEEIRPLLLPAEQTHPLDRSRLRGRRPAAAEPAIHRAGSLVPARGGASGRRRACSSRPRKPGTSGFS